MTTTNSTSNSSNNAIALPPAIVVSQEEPPPVDIVINIHQIEFIDSIKSLAENIDKGDSKSLQVIHTPPTKNINFSQRPKLTLFYLKPVIACIPHKNFPGIQLLCPNCPSQNTILTAKGWPTTPVARYIHDVKSGVYLLQYRYYCSFCRKSVMSNDAVMPTFAKQSYSFYVTEHSGMTTDLLEKIITEATNRTSFEEITENMGINRTSEYLKKRVMYESWCVHYNELRQKNRFETKEDFPPFSNFNDPGGYNEISQLYLNYATGVFKSKE